MEASLVGQFDTRMDVPVQESEGITDSEINTAIKVAEYLSANLDVYRSGNLRAFRMALQPLIALQTSSMFAGTDSQTLVENKRRNTRRKQEAHRSKVEDEKLIQKTVLRAGRMKKLQETASSNGSHLPLVLDGVANDGVNSTILSPADLVNGCIEDSENGDISERSTLRLHNFRACYICKRRYQELHHFYDLLCPNCADLNWSKRIQTCDMRGKVCLVTGGRVKIGFQCCLKLLRCGATVIATSRFPVDTAKRFSIQTDFEEWRDRLHVYGLDLRDLAYVEAFCDMTLRSYSRLDAIINNACQTIRRPTAYYSHMMEEEVAPVPESLRVLLERDVTYRQTFARLQDGGCMGTHTRRIETGTNGLASDNQRSDFLDIPSVRNDPLSSAGLSQVPLIPEDSLSDTQRVALFPCAARDVNQQQVDLRRENSWLLRMHQVSSPEVAEVFAINSISPFIMVARLKPLLIAGKRRAEEKSSQKDRQRDIKAHSAESSRTAPLLSLAEFVLMQEKQKSDGGEGQREKGKDNGTGRGGYSGDGSSTAFDTAHGARAEDIPAANCSFVVNVSSMEGKFYRRKMASHPHTNMAKAALNMMTRTVAGDYRQDDIFMTAVDTG